jgi:hypothetical protein
LCEWLRSDAISKGLAAAATGGARAAVQAAVAAERHEVRLRPVHLLLSTLVNAVRVCLAMGMQEALAVFGMPAFLVAEGRLVYCSCGPVASAQGMECMPSYTGTQLHSCAGAPIAGQVLERALPESADQLMSLVMQHAAAGPAARFAAAQLMIIASTCVVRH